MEPVATQLAEAIREAGANKTSLRITGGKTKDFYGNPTTGETLSTSAYRGIVEYEPTELVIIARAGTPVVDIETALREKGQMLAFEPPHFGANATLGGCVAAGLSGPRRAYAGAVRDLVLGVRMLDGKGTDLKFGGQVIDRKSTRLNSSHSQISYAVFCLKKKTKQLTSTHPLSSSQST